MEVVARGRRGRALVLALVGLLQEDLAVLLPILGKAKKRKTF